MITSYIDGHLIGRIWMPAVECSKPVSINLNDARDRLYPSRVASLRHIIVRACADGDFRSCKFSADSVLIVESQRRVGNKTVIHQREIPLNEIESIADCVSEEYSFDTGE